MRCPICFSNNIKELHSDLFDNRYGCPDLVDINRCRKCFHCFVNPPLSPASVASLYETYYGREAIDFQEVIKGASHSIKSSRFMRWMKGTNNLGQYYAPKSGKLLDIGTGDCQNLLEASLLGITASGFDVDSHSSVIAQSLGLSVKTGTKLGDVLQSREFDWVQLNQVVEHYIDPIQELQALQPLINPDGRIFIATPNSRSIYRLIFRSNWINWHVPYHQHHFSKKSLRICLESAGFRVLTVRTVTPLVWSQIQVATIGQRVVRGEPSKFWQATESRKFSRSSTVNQINVLFRKFRTLLRIGVSSALIVFGRFVDVLKLGDSLVMIAVKIK